MPPIVSDLDDTTRQALHRAGALLTDMMTPTLRLGVTGLSRAGKTIFITALIRNLVSGGRLPFFMPEAEGRIERAYLEPQPDDEVPRFDYEAHLETLARDPPEWPESTRRLSQVRITIEFQSAQRPAPRLRHLASQSRRRRLSRRVADRSAAARAELRARGRRRGGRAGARTAPPGARESLAASFSPPSTRPRRKDEQVALRGAHLFAAYLKAARADDHVLHTTGPGRFLLPGDLEGSPLLTFCPLALGDKRRATARSRSPP